MSKNVPIGQTKKAVASAWWHSRFSPILKLSFSAKVNFASAWHIFRLAGTNPAKWSKVDIGGVRSPAVISGPGFSRHQPGCIL